MAAEVTELRPPGIRPCVLRRQLSVRNGAPARERRVSWQRSGKPTGIPPSLIAPYLAAVAERAIPSSALATVAEAGAKAAEVEESRSAH